MNIYESCSTLISRHWRFYYCSYQTSSFNLLQQLRLNDPQNNLPYKLQVSTSFNNTGWTTLKTTYRTNFKFQLTSTTQVELPSKQLTVQTSSFNFLQQHRLNYPQNNLNNGNPVQHHLLILLKWHYIFHDRICAIPQRVETNLFSAHTE